MNRAWLLAVGVVWAAGCTCGGPTGPARDVFTSYCKFIDRCPEQIEFPIAYRSLGECVDILNFTATCRVEQVESLSGDQVPKLKQLTLNIDAAQAAACQAWLDTASCQTRLTACSSQSDAGCNPCSALFASSLGSGGGTGGGSGRGLDEACDESTPCAPQLYCISARSSDDGGVSCRVCKPLRSVGGNCVDPPYVPCVSGLYCSPQAGVCVGLASPGVPCERAEQCASSFCHPTTRLCDPGGRLGDACQMTIDCRQDLCDPVTHICTARAPNGAACSVGEQCQGGLCDVGTLKCGRADGASCSSSGQCQGWCNSSTSVCAAVLPQGTSCSTSESCEGRYCHPSTDRCATPCSAGCQASQTCDSYGACTALLELGAACNDADECSSGFCNAQERCANRPGIGESCGNSVDCMPKGYCSGGVCKAYARPGDSCVAIDSCAPPFLCQKGTCTLISLACKPAAIGAQCAWLQVCEAGATCNPLNDFTCEAQKASGGACLRTVDCAEDLYCSNRVCASAAVAGATCDNRTQCAPGLFCDEAVSPHRCSAPKAAGALCENDSDCQSLDCSSSSGAGYTCQAACNPVAPGAQPACHPTRCADLGYTCGTLESGCGETQSCGQCRSAYETCGGGGQAQRCGCTPTRGCRERDCNTSVDDGCGHAVQCGASCDAGTCGATIANVCGCASDRTAGPSAASAGASVMIAEMGGGFAVWEQLGSLSTRDDAGAHVRIDTLPSTSKSSQFLVASGFGFNLPPTAMVNGIQARVRRYATGQVNDAEVALFSGGKRLGRLSGDTWQPTWSVDVVGSAYALWNYPFTAAQINSPDFGVGWSVSSVGVSDSYVDDVQLTVTYAYRCDCAYACKGDSECGSDGCGGTCGSGCGDAGTCASGYCHPPVFIDSATGLMWNNEGFDQSSCANLVLGGYSDWRVPTIDELRTRIVGCPGTAPGGQCGVTTSCTSAACLDAGCAGCPSRLGPDPHGCYLDNHTEWIACTGGYAFFSSTLSGSTPFVVDFATGQVRLSSGDSPRYRCVRP